MMDRRGFLRSGIGIAGGVGAVGSLGSPANAGTHDPHAGLRIDQEAGPNPWTHLRFENSRDDFQFAIVSDRTGGRRPGVFSEAVDKLNLLRPEFVMSVGDLIEGVYTDEGAEEELTRQWDEFDAIVDRLTMPFFYVGGNHDFQDPFHETVWRRRHGRPYYSFSYRDVLFLCLDTEDPPRPDRVSGFSEAQQDMVRRALEDNPHPRWVFVFMHRPNSIHKHGTRPEDWDRIAELLADHPYTVFAGHLHTYAKYAVDGREHYRLGVTGGVNTWWGTTYGAFDHVVWVTMKDDGPQIVNLLLDGIVENDVIYGEASEATFPMQSVSKQVSVEIEPVTSGAPRGIASVAIRNDSLIALDAEALFVPSAELALLPGAFEAHIAPSSVETIELAYVVGDRAPAQGPLALEGVFTFSRTLPNGERADLAAQFDTSRLEIRQTFTVDRSA